MPAYGRVSKARLATTIPILQDIFNDVIACLPWTDPISGITINDCSIICGHRNKIEQDLAYKLEKSQVKWPDGMHNFIPSLAVDSVPYHDKKPHIHWKDIDEMEAYKRLVFDCAKKRGYKLRWGADWNANGIRVDKDPNERLLDGPHFELIFEKAA